MARAVRLLEFVTPGPQAYISPDGLSWMGDMYMADETYSGVRPRAVSAEGISFVKNIMAPTRDGTKLALDIHVPAGEGPWPVILTYIPYRKDDQEPLTGMQYHWAQHGYVGARVDCRGTGSSEGANDDEYRPIEIRDGYDVVEWIAAQDWCDGKVAMTGGSYGGFTSVQVAALAPPHLETIIPWNFTDDRYTDDCHYRGGALRCYYDIGAYGSSMVGMNAMPPYPRVQRRPLGRALGAAPGAKQPVPAHLAGQSKGR